jgi:mRNA interferase MazF
MPGKCLRGAVVIVGLDPTVGHEQKKTRPCVVVQNNISNARSSTTIVVPVTGTENVRKLSPTHVVIPKGEGGLDKDSVVLCEQIRAIDESRLQGNCGFLGETTMAKVDEALRISLGLPEW